MVVVEAVLSVYGCKIAKESTFVTRKNATYNCPYVNNGKRKSIPATSSDYP